MTRSQLNRELKDAESSHDLTKSDKDMADTVRTLVLAELAKGNQDIAKVYADKVKFLGNKVNAAKSEYTKQKIEDTNKTKGPSGGTSPGMKSDIAKGSDLFNGNVRRNVVKKISEGVYQ